MTEKELKFLKDYKKICLKHNIQILGFDNGAFLIKLGKEEKIKPMITWIDVKYDNGSMGHEDVKFANEYEKDEVKKGIRNSLK